MYYVNLDNKWEFRRGFVDSLGGLNDTKPLIVDLPHDGMISLDTDKDVPGKYDSGYYPGDMCNYTKYVDIPVTWAGEKVFLSFDGAMLNATVEINGSRVGEHHYGYTPFLVDITDYVTFGATNRITVNTNTGVQPSCRWYTGSGLYRSVSLAHSSRIYIAHDGINVSTKEVSDGIAFLETEIDVCNETLENKLVELMVYITKDGAKEPLKQFSKTIEVLHGKRETARIAFTIENPELWDVDSPSLHNIKVEAREAGNYHTHLVKNSEGLKDEAEAFFGIRTITVDAIRGLRINGKTVKLKGGCVHHDNGLIGAASLYESEARKVLKLKEVGFNAIRTAHNPPSKALVEACDRLGMYIFDEAYDAWGMAKRPGDFSNYFNLKWEDEIEAFVRRDRVHPSVIMWSTGNEIPERGGLSNGYVWATKLAMKIRSLDASRPISNGICSFWSGLDDELAKGQDSTQNAQNEDAITAWDKLVEPFTNGLDVVGYNYMEDLYENSHKLFPDRVILGSENFPKEIGFRWPVVEKLPYVIGDFTWTAWDYIGEAGIGKSIFFEPDDPQVKLGSWGIMPPSTSPYPWKLANDADFDITGLMRPQGAYRSVVWGSEATHLFTIHPMHYGKVEISSMWGFTDVLKNWNYEEFTGKPVTLVVFSNADEVEVLVNGKSLGRKAVGYERPLPYSVSFETEYSAGKVEAISYKAGKEVSRDVLETTGAPCRLSLVPSKTTLVNDSHDISYVDILVLDEKGRVVPDAEIKLTATVSGAGYLAGFGTGNPKTEDNYTKNDTISYKGHAMAVLRNLDALGDIELTVEAPLLNLSEKTKIKVVPMY